MIDVLSITFDSIKQIAHNLSHTLGAKYANEKYKTNDFKHFTHF